METMTRSQYYVIFATLLLSFLLPVLALAQERGLPDKPVSNPPDKSPTVNDVPLTSGMKGLAAAVVKDAVIDARAFARPGQAQGPVLLDADSFIFKLQEETKASLAAGAFSEAVGALISSKASVRRATQEEAIRASEGSSKGQSSFKVADDGVFVRLREVDKTNAGLSLTVEWSVTSRRPSGSSATTGQWVEYRFVRGNDFWQLAEKKVVRTG